MKNLLLCLVLSAIPAAASPRLPSNLRKPIVISATGFNATLDDGRVIVSWRRYKRDDFVSYNVVKSTEADPMYPPAAPVYTSRGQGDVDFEDGYLLAGTWHYRLVILTRYGDRWVSPAATVEIGPDQVKRSAPTEADFEP